MPNLYIIAGCNGAGKSTTGIFDILKTINCKEFVCIESIAAGLSPFNSQGKMNEAERLMLFRVSKLIDAGIDFALKDVPAINSLTLLVWQAKRKGYIVNVQYVSKNLLNQVEENVKLNKDSLGTSSSVNHSNPTELFEKILQGMRKASRKLVEESAALGRSLVISENGEVKRVPAKELLLRLSKKN